MSLGKWEQTIIRCPGKAYSGNDVDGMLFKGGHLLPLHWVQLSGYISLVMEQFRLQFEKCQ